MALGHSMATCILRVDGLSMDPWGRGVTNLILGHGFFFFLNFLWLGLVFWSLCIFHIYFLGSFFFL